MKLAALVLALVACGKKPADPPAASGSPPPVAVAPADAADTAVAAVAVDAGDAVDAEPPSEYAVTVSPDGVATMEFKKAGLKATLKLPEGWATGKHEVSEPFGFHFEPPNVYGRPYLDFIVFDDEPTEKRIGREYGELGKKVNGGGKLEVVTKADLPEGKLISIAVDASKERSVVYVETICFFGKPGTNVTFRLNAFAEKKDEAIQPTFEAICKAVAVAPL